jgi:uncharacterized protein (TIGR02118 family)
MGTSAFSPGVRLKVLHDLVGPNKPAEGEGNTTAGGMTMIKTGLLHHHEGAPFRRGVCQWEAVHGSMGARIPQLRKLVQSHRLTVPGDRYRRGFDGMAELCFDDIESLLTARQSPEWTAATEDEENFIDHSKVSYFVSDERIIFEQPKQIKQESQIVASRRKSRLTIPR